MELNPSFIDNYIAEEVLAGRMSGPYTMEEAYIFFGGHFRTAPLGLVEKAPAGSGKWRMVQNNSVLDNDGVSTNSWLDSKEFSIGWHTCSMMADIVSPLFYHLSSFPRQFNDMYDQCSLQ